MSKKIGLDLKSKRVRKRSDYVFHEDYRSRWADNDMFHHLNNPIYGVLIDSIINSYLIAQAGYNPGRFEYSALVAHTYCDYFGSAHYPGMLECGLRVVTMGKSSVKYEVGVFQEGEEDVKAVGGFIQIWVRAEDNRPTAEGIPKAVREKLEALWNSREEEETKSKL